MYLSQRTSALWSKTRTVPKLREKEGGKAKVSVALSIMVADFHICREM